MAKLNSYYTLCPLIDQQNLLGVEKDSNPGCAIVTLGRNIVIRYKLQDLKQISSWSSKERITTQVIYDQSTQKYAAVFNERRIRVWSEEDSDLNNIKGYKFQEPLHTILTSNVSPPVVVRRDGATASLEWALQNRKTWSSDGILKPNEKLIDCQLICLDNKTILCSLTLIEQTYNYIVVKLKDQTYLPDTDHVRRIELKRTSEELVGHVIMPRKNNAYLLTLWSHGRLYSHPLIEGSQNSNDVTLISVITNMNTKYPVVMTYLNETIIAAYGADISEEGAILMIYNVQFKLVQAVQKLKLYTRDAKLWRVEDKLLLAANRHLAIAPYQLAPQRIAAMLGSSLHFQEKDKENDEEDIMVIQESTVAQWEEQSKSARLTTSKVPRNISKQISGYINEGLSDSRIQEALIPQLIESKDVATIIWCLDTFKDLPEKHLIDLLAFSLRTPDETLAPLQNGTTDADSKVNKQFSRSYFIEKIFTMSYSDVTLLSYLKSGLQFNETLRLLDYLIEKLNETEDSLDHCSQLSDKQLYDWSSILLDSHYQHYVLSQDPHVLTLLEKLNDVLENHFQLLKDMEDLRPMLSRIINGKSLKPSPKNGNRFYSIEEIKLY